MGFPLHSFKIITIRKILINEFCDFLEKLDEPVFEKLMILKIK